MMCVSNWVYIIKDILKSEKTKNEIKRMLLQHCLYSPYKFNGMYQVSSEKVWALIKGDVRCARRLEELGLRDAYDVISYYEQTGYKKMRGTFPRNRHKKGR